MILHKLLYFCGLTTRSYMQKEVKFWMNRFEDMKMENAMLRRAIFGQCITVNGGNCYYCGLPMRPKNGPKKLWLEAFGLHRGHPEAKKMLRHVLVTREHLVMKAVGGANDPANIVHAHAYCNTSRGFKSPERHRNETLASLALETHLFVPLMRHIKKIEEASSVGLD